MRDLVVAVDVGTTSARAGVFDAGGTLLARAERPIRLHRPRPEHAEHQSSDIWNSATVAVREALAVAEVPGERVAGISFDATCSLVVLDADGLPVPVSADEGEVWDTIVWQDHRAIAEAEACTASGHRVLDYIGGKMSPEMETPKLMWLKRHLPASWGRAGLLLDLADFLGWKASGSRARSQCTLACKWTFLAHEDPGWQADFLAAMGLEDLLERGGLPGAASPVGTDLGPLTAAAARTLGLSDACRVGVGLIDAHAGALGVLGGVARSGDEAGLDRHLGLIAGTSTCHMALSSQPRPVAGVWGPYFGAVLPGTWLNEGGQSATGALLDHIIRSHGAGGEPTGSTHGQIVERVQELRAAEGPTFAAGLHVLPDFHGNRSPLADPHAVGVISGLTLDASFDSLCRLYWRTAVSIALGTRHIVDALNGAGYAIDTLHVTGGHTKNPLLMELYADATGCTVIEPGAQDAVLLGSAMVAATAAGIYPDLPSAAAGMARSGRERRPDPQATVLFERDYRVFLLMHEQRRALETVT